VIIRFTARPERPYLTFTLDMRRLSDNPKIGAVDHAEIVADSVAEPFPAFGHDSDKRCEHSGKRVHDAD
jgi:hypothetical protein